MRVESHTDCLVDSRQAAEVKKGIDDHAREDALDMLVPMLVIRLELFLWPVAGWSACFVPLGLALYQQGSVPSLEEAFSLIRCTATGDEQRRGESGSHPFPLFLGL